MNKYFIAIIANLTTFSLNTIFFLIIIPLSIRIMEKELFGLWSIVYSIMLLSNVGTAGIGSIINKFASESHHNVQEYQQKIISNGMVIAVVFSGFTAILIFLFSGVVAEHLKINTIAQQRFKIALYWVAISTLPQFLSKVFQGYLLSQLKHFLARQLDMYFSMLLWIGVVLISYLNSDIRWIGAWCLVVSILLFLGYFLVVRKLVRLVFWIDFSVVNMMMNFSIFLFFEMIAIGLFQNMDKVILGLTLGPVLAGIYAVGTSVSLRISMVTGQITDILIPYASLADSLHERRRLYRMVRKISFYVSILVGFLGGILILWMDYFLRFWISSEYAQQYSNLFRIIILSYSFLSLSRPAHQSLMGLGKVKFTSIVYIISTTIMLLALFFLSSNYGILGAGWANLFMAILISYNMYIYFIFDRKRAFKKVSMDIGLTIFLLIILYSLVSLWSFLWLRVLITIIMIFIVGVIVIRDSWLIDRAAMVLSEIKK